MTSIQLQRICDALPRLVQLSCGINDAAQGLTLPSSLTDVRVGFGFGPEAGCAEFVGSLAQLPSLTHLALSGSMRQLAALVPTNLRAVRSLVLEPADFKVLLPSALIACIRSFPNLTELIIQRIDLSSWLALLARPHDLKLESVSMPGADGSIDDRILDALLGVPTLRSLSGTLRCTTISWISQLPNLTSLHFVCRLPPAVQLDALLEQISTCRQLRSLTLQAHKDTLPAQKLARCLSQLHALEMLCLSSIMLLGDFRHFMDPCWGGSLKGLNSLILDQVSALPPSQPAEMLQSLHPLWSLSVLQLLRCSFMTEPSAELLSRYRVPSAIFPQLSTFIYG